MFRPLLLLIGALFTGGISLAFAQEDGGRLAQERWFEVRTAHFDIYSCGAIAEVGKVANRLEQFRDAYALLAGAQVVKSPPIVVMAFPDQKAMEPFLPLYNGKPANLAAFFKRGTDENLIVLALHGNSDSMSTIFHEYTHLLLRHNQELWPLWLQEGMAEIHSTFEATGRGVKFGQRIENHVRLLQHTSLMPVKELIAVSHDSPDYNEGERQNIFYAESWLLTHFLMNGDNALYKARFRNFLKLLKDGEEPAKAFARALGQPADVQAELRRYLERGQFEAITTVLPMDVSAPHAMSTRALSRAEASFRLGNELMRIGRLESAEPFFIDTQKLAPQSPLSCEGLGMLAVLRGNALEATTQMKEALRRGSSNFLVYYEYAEQRFRQTGDAEGHHTRVAPELAEELRADLNKSIGLMPDFAPAQEMLGFLELLQQQNLASAEENLQRAAQLEPENRWYLIPLAEAQSIRREPDAARHTLEPLLATHIEAKLHAAAERVLQEVNRPAPGR